MNYGSDFLCLFHSLSLATSQPTWSSFSASLCSVYYYPLRFSQLPEIVSQCLKSKFLVKRWHIWLAWVANQQIILQTCSSKLIASVEDLGSISYEKRELQTESLIKLFSYSSSFFFFFPTVVLSSLSSSSPPVVQFSTFLACLLKKIEDNVFCNQYDLDLCFSSLPKDLQLHFFLTLLYTCFK